jgi:dihydrofolate reductase
MQEKIREQYFIIGGQSVYEQTISLADRLEITEVHKNYEGNSYFPEIDPNIWDEV